MRNHGYVYVGVVYEVGFWVTEPYPVQVDVGNASFNSPYVASADRINNRIKADGTVDQDYQGSLFRCDEHPSWNTRGAHPRLASKKNRQLTIFIKESATKLDDGTLTVEMKLDAVEIMKYFSEHEKYRGKNTELRSQAITWMIWLDNITSQFCVPADPNAYDAIWKGHTVTWGWAMYTIVLPEKPAARYADKEPAGEMKWDQYDARNMFEGQVMTVSKIAETLPTLDGVIGEGEYTDTFAISIYNNQDRKGTLHMS